jgi:hypothetical protein
MILMIEAVTFSENSMFPLAVAADPFLFIREPFIRSRKGAGVAPMNTGIIYVC